MNPFQLSNLLYLTTVESINTITAHLRSLPLCLAPYQAIRRSIFSRFVCASLYAHLSPWHGTTGRPPSVCVAVVVIESEHRSFVVRRRNTAEYYGATIMNWHQSLPCHIQLFRKRLSEKVHATIPKGIVGGFEITVLHRNFERMAREAMDYVSEC